MRLKLWHIDMGCGIALTIAAVVAVAVALLMVRFDMPIMPGVVHTHGIDVSHHQQVIDWKQVAQNKRVQFAYIKATEGATMRDIYYRYNMQSCREAGIKAGCYHYFHPNIDVGEQAANFVCALRLQEQDLLPVIDVEVSNDMTGEEICSSVNRMAQLIEEAMGVRPMIYTHQKFYNTYLSGEVDDYPLWIARYGLFAIENEWIERLRMLPIKIKPILHDGRQPTLWQYSCTGNIEGIKVDVNLNSFCGNFKLNDIEIVK